jgi:tetratricopeptide (TPR) repeat protein
MSVKIHKQIIALLMAVLGTTFGAACASSPGAATGREGSYEPALASASELVEHQNFDDAITILSGLIGKNPKLSDAYALRAVCYYRMEEFERANRDFREYFKTAKEPCPIAYHRLYGLSLCQFQKFPEALEQFNIDIKREPKVWDYWFDRTQLYTNTKQYDKALADANVMVKLKPDHYRYALRAKIYWAMGNYQKSVDDWTAAIAQLPDRRDYYACRADCYDKLGKPALAASDRKKRDVGLE